MSSAGLSAAASEPLLAPVTYIASPDSTVSLQYVQKDLNGGLAAVPPADEYAGTPERWWVLFVFCLLSFGQSLIWVTFSPITDFTEKYYSISEFQVESVKVQRQQGSH
jgi:hypothetical protein